VHSKTPFTAFADLIDNAKDAGAAYVKISVGKSHDKPHLIFQDNGPGANFKQLTDMLDLGCSTSRNVAGKSGHCTLFVGQSWLIN
jgi:sensor histidine kinase regulating citrate/malate metabolism